MRLSVFLVIPGPSVKSVFAILTRRGFHVADKCRHARSTPVTSSRGRGNILSFYKYTLAADAYYEARGLQEFRLLDAVERFLALYCTKKSGAQFRIAIPGA
jgi:hypothetical protein